MNEEDERSVAFGGALILLNEAVLRKCSVQLTRSEAAAVLHALQNMAGYVAEHKACHK